MKKKNQFTNRILSLALVFMMVVSMLPASTLTVFAASDSPEYHASDYLDGASRPAVFANGNDLIIEAGSTSGTTSVYYMSGGTKTAVVENVDLSNAYIFAGHYSSAAILNEDVTITMNGGRVLHIYASNRDVGSVKGNVTIIMGEDATVGEVHPYYSTNAPLFNGKLRIFAANGKRGTTVYYKSFDGQVIKTSDGWSVTGDAMVPADCTMDIAEGTTATIASGATLTNNGSIVNNGTIYLQKSYTQLKGIEPTGNGDYIVELPYVTNASAVTAASVDGTAVENPGYKKLGDKLYLDVSQGKVWARIDEMEYYCDFIGEQTPMQPYTSVTAIGGMPASMNANTSVALVASVLPANVLAQNFTYEIADAGTTGATVNGNTLTTPFGGTALLRVTATDGYRSFTNNFNISVNQVAVTGIANDNVIPTSEEPSSIALPTQVVPADATYKTIVWTVTGPGTVSGNTLKLSGAGAVKLTATVKNGLGKGQDYIKSYNIDVSAPEALDISYGEINIQKTDGGHTVRYFNESGQQSQFYSADQLIVITGTTTENSITIMSGLPKLVLKNCSIQLSNYQAINIYNSADGAEITLEGTNILKAATGIYVPQNASLTIDGSGQLDATGINGPGVGSGTNYASGTIVINGGTVTATGSLTHAGIGGWMDNNSEIIINDGKVTAYGGDYAAGIGGKDNYAGIVTINGGTVNATGGKHGAGIGGGENGAGTVIISGGTVTANGGERGAAIGGGYDGAGTVTISDGTVIATGGEDGAGIGGGYKGAGDVTITNGSVTAQTSTGGHNGGTGIGGGYDGAGTVTISGGTVNATGYGYGAGIGGSYQGQGDVVISGGRVTATGGEYDTTGIGGGSRNSSGTVDISGGTIEAISNSLAAGVGRGTVTITGGSLLAKNTDTSHVWDATNGTANGNENLTLKELTIEQLTSDEAIVSATGLPNYYGLKDVQTLDGTLYFYLPGDYPTSITTSSGDIYYHAGNGLYTDHRHEWNYSVNSSLNSITATCIANDCTNTYGGSVTLNVGDAYYTGSAVEATVTGSFINGATYRVTYNDGSETAPSSLGTHTAKLTVYENGIEKQSVTGGYKIFYLEAPNPAYTISDGYQNGTTYWFQNGAAVTVNAPDGYTVSTSLNGTYEDFVSFSESDNKVIYLKRTSDGALTDAVEVKDIRFDGTGATGEITIENRGFWEKLLNKITFGLFFKGDAVAKVEVTDVDSGVNSIQYYIADTDLINDAGLTDASAVAILENAIGNNWTDYNNEIALNKNTKNVIYVKITDNVGNVTCLSSEGIVLYSDAQAVTESVSATYKSNADKEVIVELNGNTVKEIKNGTAILAAGTDYTVSDDGKIMLKSVYLDTLKVGTYTFTVSYNPVGMEYIEATGNEAPATTTFTVIMEKEDGKVTNINISDKTYDGTAVTAPTYDKLGNGAATIEYKVKGEDDSTYTTTAPENAGDYVVRVTVAEDTNYKAASATAEFTINRAELTNVSVQQNGELTYDGGMALTPTVTANGMALNGARVLFIYSVDNTTYGAMPTFEEAGMYTVYYCAYTADNNFVDYYDTFTVTVDKAIVNEPTIASKPYNGSTQMADISETDLYTVVKNQGGMAKGSYNVILKLKDSANYKWSTTDNAEVIMQFIISAAENSWTTAPAINGWTYGETANTPVGAAKYGTVKVVYSGTANDGSDYNSEIAPTKAGNYTATFTVAGTEDYSGLSEQVDFCIAKKVLTVIAEDKTATYGDAVLTYTVKYDGFENGDDKDDLGGSLTFDCGYAQFDHKGEYTIKASGYTSDNYTINYVDGKLTVNAKPITVTIQNAASIYGDNIAELKATDNGIVNGDTNVYNLATDATSTSNVGKYAITGTALDSNYAITFVNGEYEITKREITITAEAKNTIVNTVLPTYTYKVEGLFGEDELVTEPTLTCNGDITIIGEYEISPSGADAGSNYSIKYVPAKLTVLTDNAVDAAAGYTDELMDYDPKTITSEDRAELDEILDEINTILDNENITDNGKKALEEVKEQVEKLIEEIDDAKTTLEELNKPAGVTSPNTGDNSNLWLWFALMFVSGTGVFGITLYDRKRKVANKR